MVCPHCRGSLGMDVVVTAEIPDERQRYKVARSLAALGPPVLGLSALREGLRRPDCAVVRGAPRAAADRILEVLTGELELQAVQRLSQTTPAGRAGSATGGAWRSAKVLGLPAGPFWAGLVLVLAGSVLLVGLMRRGSRASLGSRPRAADLSPAAFQALAEKASPSRARVWGEGMRGGAGFFVAPELVLALAHPVAPKEAQAAFLRTQKASGPVLQADPQSGLVLVSLPGAGPRPLPLADAATVREGDTLVVVESKPPGVKATRGIVTHAAFVRDGLTLIQLEAQLGADPWATPCSTPTAAWLAWSVTAIRALVWPWSCPSTTHSPGFPRSRDMTNRSGGGARALRARLSSIGTRSSQAFSSIRS